MLEERNYLKIMYSTVRRLFFIARGVFHVRKQLFNDNE